MSADVDPVKREIELEARVSFLSSADAYPEPPGRLTCRETHMSWVFIGDRLVYKMKKPVCFPYLNFLTVERREAACRAELELNRRLAPLVYTKVVPLTISNGKLAVAGSGTVVDWLVVMKRLDETQMLEHLLLDGALDRRHLDRLALALAAFYRRALRSSHGRSAHFSEWRRRVRENYRVLSDPRLAVAYMALSRIDRAQRRFLDRCKPLLEARLAMRRIVDGHGDLRPEHIWLGDPVAVIDCLEFSASLRAVDPFDELAFLGIECERLGFDWPGQYLTERVGRLLHDRIDAPLLAFYRCYRATMRARLAYAHLLEPNPRTPEKWPRQGRRYLALAFEDARRIERYLKTTGAFPQAAKSVDRGPVGRSRCPTGFWEQGR